MEKDKALEMAVLQIERQYGKGSIMRLGDDSAVLKVPAISTGSLALDLALGVGGVPRGRVVEVFGDSGGRDSTQVTVMSFGYKHGVPPDVDVVLDCRFLPNPHWVEELRPLTGLDAEVQDYVGSFELTDQFMERIEGLLELLLPAYVDEGKSVLTIAFGCTGGRHRSVSMAERLATWFRERGMDCLLLANGTYANHTPDESVPRANLQSMLAICERIVELAGDNEPAPPEGGG